MAFNKGFRFRSLSVFLKVTFFELLRLIFKLDKSISRLVKESWKVSNPMNTIWPSETTPMVSHMLASGLWNFSFFQFHRNFYFPFWAKMQYDPNHKTFIPRSHNILSINQTQRNWVSISFPGKKHEVCIDRAMAIMPGCGTPTIEFGIFESGKLIRPHDEVEEIIYQLKRSDEIKCYWRKRTFSIKAEQNGVGIKVKGGGNLIFSVRPFNMEGPALIDKLKLSPDLRELEGEISLHFGKKPDLFHLSNHNSGDSLRMITKQISKRVSVKKKAADTGKGSKKKLRMQVKDPRGLSNASFFYHHTKDCQLFIKDARPLPLPKALTKKLKPTKNGLYEADAILEEWFPSLGEAKLPGKFSEIFFNVKNHLLTLWDFNTITPGSFTYHHFWIRDATPMLYALMLLGGNKPVKTIVSSFKSMLSRSGLLKSQAGEWDANGQALWIIGQYTKLSKDKQFIIEMQKSIYKMLHWLERSMKSHEGILPPGFSAEHLGVSDWYLWDNFWAMGGISALFPFQELLLKHDLRAMYDKMLKNLNIYLKKYKYYPAALGRKKDAGMIGSISAIYPLGLIEFYNKKMLETLKILKKKHTFCGGFFQENIHSGINPYLTLQMAEALLHLGKANQAFEIFTNILKRSSLAYTFPEAIHPNSNSGCMGDGFHGWAFAEIIIFIKNIFFLELPNSIVFLAGFPEAWFYEVIYLKKIHTEYGLLDIEKRKDKLIIRGFKNIGPKKCYLAISDKLLQKVRAISGVELSHYANTKNVFTSKLEGKTLIELLPTRKNIEIYL